MARELTDNELRFRALAAMQEVIEDMEPEDAEEVAMKRRAAKNIDHAMHVISERAVKSGAKPGEGG